MLGKWLKNWGKAAFQLMWIMLRGVSLAGTSLSIFQLAVDLKSKNKTDGFHEKIGFNITSLLL